MFKCGSDEDEESNVNAVKYPCMPSLVALQQMRNRLHMAHLGKKLMKWTALATGRELRRIAKELTILYHTFREDLRNAFILIARARYFCPNLDKYVLENVPFQAALTVGTTTKSISGVKVIQFEAIESESDPYEHLGIDKGGQAISEVKTCWKNLTKSLVMILQLRVVFVQIEDAHTNANKRKNALMRIVIPKILASIKYIIDGLEEQAREDFFRLKKITKIKKKKRANVCKHMKPLNLCQECKTKKDVHEEYPDDINVSNEEVAQSIKINSTEDLLNLDKLKLQLKDTYIVAKPFSQKGILSGVLDDFLKITKELLDEILILTSSTNNAVSHINISDNVNFEAIKKEENSVKTEDSKNIKEKIIKTSIDINEFERELEEITKIIRKTKEDGVNNRTETLKYKKRVTISASDPFVVKKSSLHFASKPSCRCDDIDTDDGFKENKSLILFKEVVCRRVESEMLAQSSEMVDNFENFNISSMSLISLDSDFEVLNREFEADSFNDLIDIREDFEKMLEFARPFFKECVSETQNEDSDDSINLTESEWELIANVVGKRHIASKSANNIQNEREKVKNRNCTSMHCCNKYKEFDD